MSYNNPKRVLVVEDEPDIRHLVALQIRLLKYEAVEAVNGRKALQLIEAGQHFDLLITDACMPEMDGFELTRTLRACPNLSHIPIIMLTAYDDSLDKNRAWDVGVTDFLAKPIERDLFKATVQNLLHAVAI